MTVAAKCNIILSATEKLNELYWATNYEGLEDLILENYLEYLACPTLDIEICDNSDCINTTEVFTCSLSVNAISSVINENTIIFYIKDEDLIGNSPPYSYKWTYEEDDFDNSGKVDVNEAVLTVKEGKRLSLLVTSISVKVTDRYGCTDTKSCFLVSSVIQCGDNYAACPNVGGLTVSNKVIRCVGVTGLIVNKKL